MTFRGVKVERPRSARDLELQTRIRKMHHLIDPTPTRRLLLPATAGGNRPGQRGSPIVTRSEIAVVATCAVFAAVSVFSAWEARRASLSLHALDLRVAHLEACPAPAPSGVPDSNVTREIAALRQRVCSLGPVLRKPGDGAAAESTSRTTQIPGSTDAGADAHARVWAVSTAKRVCGSLATSLELSSQQSADVERVLLALLEEYRRDRKGGDADLAAKAAEVLKAHTAAQVKPLLTPEQQERFDKIASSERGVFAPVPGGQDSPWGVNSNPVQPGSK